MTKREKAVQAVIDGKHRFRGYPRHYAMRATGGWSLVAAEGPHKGGVFGTLWLGGCVTLCGRANFRRNGGGPRQYLRCEYTMKFSGGRWRADAPTNLRTHLATGGTWRVKP